MASELFLDLSTIDLDRVLIPKERIYESLPHRFEFMQLDAILHIDHERQVGVALRDVREDEFWVRGHIPGRPLFPGVLMVESAAQLAAYLTREFAGEKRFVAFGGIDGFKFRAAVTPPARLYLLLHAVELRPRRTIADVQGVLDGKLVFEGRVTGMPM